MKSAKESFILKGLYGLTKRIYFIFGFVFKLFCRAFIIAGVE